MCIVNMDEKDHSDSVIKQYKEYLSKLSLALYSVQNLNSAGDPIVLKSSRLYKLLLKNKHKINRSEYYYSPEDITMIILTLGKHRDFLNLQVK
jgi:hypothetical protein